MAFESPMTPVAATPRVALGSIQVVLSFTFRDILLLNFLSLQPYSPLPDLGIFLQFQAVTPSSTTPQPRLQSQPRVKQLNGTENTPVTPSATIPRTQPQPRPLVPQSKAVENPQPQPLTAPRPLIPQSKAAENPLGTPSSLTSSQPQPLI